MEVFEMPGWNWQLYGQYTPGNPTDGPIFCHEIYSKNGAYGECLICFDSREKQKPWFIIAGGNDTGRLWKSPDEMFSTVEEAKKVAEKTWRPVIKNG